MPGVLQINSGSSPSRPLVIESCASRRAACGQRCFSSSAQHGTFSHQCEDVQHWFQHDSIQPGTVQENKEHYSVYCMLYTVQICFNLHNMDKMSILNHVPSGGHSVLGTQPLQMYSTRNLSAVSSGKLPTQTVLARRLTLFLLKVEVYRSPRRTNLKS